MHGAGEKMNGRTNAATAKAIALGTAVVLFAAGCATDAPQDTNVPKGPEADKIYNLIVPVFGIAAVVFVAILGGALFVALKFRATDDEDYDEFPEQVHGNFRLEIGWTIAPAVILAVVAFFTVATVFDLARKPSQEAVTVEVTGQQWWWGYEYEVDVDGDGENDEIITANDLVIPTGVDIDLRIMSNDVIHSWWAPALNGKKDAVPGRVHGLIINAPDPGEYIGQCTEFCGLSHAEMRVKVIAVAPAEFQAWMEKQIAPFEGPAGSAAARGWTAFASQCTSCHRIDGMTDPSAPLSDELFEYPDEVLQVAGVVPNLTKFMSRTTFAGAKFELRLPTEACEARGLNWADTEEGITECLNRKDLEAWLRNAPAEKAMAAGEVPSLHSRGMNNFNLTEDQIDDFVAFLITLQ
jgi:cytochrome c oxidase subunit 2